CRRLLDDLLIATLQSAVTGRHDADIAVGVGQALRLDVSRAHDLLLDEALTAAERALGLTGRGRVSGLEVVSAGAGAESATAAAVDGLDDDREADVFGNLRGFGQIGHRPVGTGCDGGVDG